MNFVIDDKLINEIGSYLASRPFFEVEKFITEIRGLKQVTITQPKTTQTEETLEIVE